MDDKPMTVDESPTPLNTPKKNRRRLVTKVGEGNVKSGLVKLQAMAERRPKEYDVKTGFAPLRPIVLRLKGLGYAEQDIVDALVDDFAGLTVSSLRYLMKRTENLEVPEFTPPVARQPGQSQAAAGVSQGPAGPAPQPVQQQRTQDPGQSVQGQPQQRLAQTGPGGQLVQQRPPQNGQQGQPGQQRQTAPQQARPEGLPSAGDFRKPTNPDQRRPGQ